MDEFDRREVEIAGLHPRSESIIPYMIGHVIPVPSETGASYGDLDDQYLTANYKIFLNEDEAQRTFGYIKHLQKTQVLWHAALYNCVSFIRDIAIFVGLKVPSTPLLKPEEWVNELLELNGKSPKIAVQSHRY